MKSRVKKSSAIGKFALMFAALAFVLPLAASLAEPVYANSGSPWSEGVDSMGVRTLYDEGVLEVQSENLTFNINNGPSDLEEGELYDATVTAEYTFYNPTDETVTTTFVFPYGNKPEEYTIANEKEIKNPVTVNGNPVECELRYTYGQYYNFDEQVEQIKDEYTETDFYKRDTPVYAYKIKVTPGDESVDYLRLEASVSVDKSKTRFFALRDNDDTIYLSVYDDNSMETSLYVIGEDYDVSSLTWSNGRYNSEAGDYETNLPMTVTVSKETETTLWEYFLSLRGEAKASDLDWWNMCMDALSEAEAAGRIVINGGRLPDSESFEYASCSWYVYRYTAAPGERFNNTVTAPLYPEVNHNYDCGYYAYIYYLSPAKSWASFKDLTVNINTEMYMQSAYADENIDFEKTETGYTVFFETLPEGELHFTLSTEESPSYTRSYIESRAAYTLFGIMIILILFVLPIIWVVILIIALVVVLKNKKGRRPPSPPYPPYPLYPSQAPVNYEGGNPSGGSENAAQKDINPDFSGSDSGEKPDSGSDDEKPKEE